jgi:hypothetical protein
MSRKLWPLEVNWYLHFSLHCLACNFLYKIRFAKNLAHWKALYLQNTKYFWQIRLAIADIASDVELWVHMEPIGDAMSSLWPLWPYLVILQDLLLSLFPLFSFIYFNLPLFFGPVRFCSSEVLLHWWFPTCKSDEKRYLLSDFIH